MAPATMSLLKLVGPSLATLVVNQDVTVNADITA
jgi:hypothetical protein